MTAAWDPVRSGDPDPEPAHAPCCCATAPPSLLSYLCTRDPHDGGQHVATDGRTVLAVWPYDEAAS